MGGRLTTGAENGFHFFAGDALEKGLASGSRGDLGFDVGAPGGEEAGEGDEDGVDAIDGLLADACRQGGGGGGGAYRKDDTGLRFRG